MFHYLQYDFKFLIGPLLTLMVFLYNVLSKKKRNLRYIVKKQQDLSSLNQRLDIQLLIFILRITGVFKKMVFDKINIFKPQYSNTIIYRKEDLKIFDAHKSFGYSTNVFVTIINDGNEEILRNDFEEQLEISCRYRLTDWISAVAINKSPENLPVKLKKREDIIKTSEHSFFDTIERAILIEPFLMNPKDFFTIRITTNTDPSIRLKGRVKGVKKFKQSERVFNYNVRIFPIFLVATIFYWYFKQKNIELKLYYLLFGIVIVINDLMIHYVIDLFEIIITEAYHGNINSKGVFIIPSNS